jgi:hypothetical protein
MGFGILEDRKLSHVPATVFLNEDAPGESDITEGLKHGTGKSSHIVLAPQPSEDPNDPLNWPSWKKEMVFLTLNYAAVLCASVVSPMLNPATVVLATYFNRSITDIVVISGYLLLAVGCSG